MSTLETVKYDRSLRSDALEHIRQKLAAAAPFSCNHAGITAMRRHFDAIGPRPRPDTQVMRVVESQCQGYWFVPTGVSRNRRILLIHGGAFVSCSAQSHGGLACHLGRAADASVFLLEYPLAPEAPAPAALDAATSALSWIFANGPDGPAAADRVDVIGDASGGNVALALLVRARSEQLAMPNTAAFLSIWCDLAFSGPNLEALKAVDPFIHLEQQRYFAACYAAGRSLIDPTVSPLFTDDLSGLPPILLQVGSEEILQDDSTRLASRLAHAGVAARLELWGSMFHTWQFWEDAPESREAVSAIAAFLHRY